MGLKYVSSESSSLITALTTNISAVQTTIENLTTGANELTAAVDGKTLSGAAYTAASGLFQDCILPAIQQTKIAVESVRTDLSSYQNHDGTVSGEGTLDEDLLTQKIATLRQSKASAESTASSLAAQSNTLKSQGNISSSTQSWLNTLASLQSNLASYASSLQADIDEEERKLRLLRDFSSNTSGLFSSSLDGLSVSMQAVMVLSRTIVNTDGTYSLPVGADASWFKSKQKGVENTIFYTLNNIPKNMSAEEAENWILKNIQKYGGKFLDYILDDPDTFVDTALGGIKTIFQVKRGKAFLNGVAITMDETGVMRWGNKFLYDAKKGVGTSASHLFKPEDFDGKFNHGKDFEKAMDGGFKWNQFFYARNADGSINWRNMGKSGLASLKDSWDFSKKFNVKQNFKEWSESFKDAGKLGKLGKLAGKGLSIASTAYSVYGNWQDNTKNGKTDLVGFASDAAVDVSVNFATGSVATAIGSAVGSAFFPPLGTVAGFAAGAAINYLANGLKFGNPPKSAVGYLKSGAKSAVKWLFGG